MDIGSEFQTRSGGVCVVEKLLPGSKVMVRFKDEKGHSLVVTRQNLRAGSVKNPYAPSVFGIGFIGVGQHPVSFQRKDTQLYGRWKAILQRCFSEKFQIEKPSYRGCSIDPRWRDFQEFAGWVVDQPGYGEEDWEIDKDFLNPGNKVYGPDTCILIPQRLNKLMTGTNGANGLSRGVSWHERYGKYGATCRDGTNKDIFLGRFDSEHEAFSAYKSFKESVIRDAAESFRSVLDPRAYEAFVRYEVKP